MADLLGHPGGAPLQMDHGLAIGGHSRSRLFQGQMAVQRVRFSAASLVSFARLAPEVVTEAKT
jgi:hypothetical protein